MKKLILIAVLMLVSSSIFAQDIFGPPNYFFKRNDSVFVRPGSVFGNTPDLSAYALKTQLDTMPQFNRSVNTFTKKMVIGTGTSNGTNDFLVMGDSTTIRGTVLRDSSIFRVSVNPFSQRLKIQAIGKTGLNMLTVDSTAITTALPITADLFEATASSSGFVSSTTGYFFWKNSSLINAPANGTVKFTNFAGTTNATLIFGKFKMDLLPTYADNAAALSGGLTAGDGYKTSSGVVMITY